MGGIVIYDVIPNDLKVCGAKAYLGPPDIVKKAGKHVIAKKIWTYAVLLYMKTRAVYVELASAILFAEL